MYHHSQQQGSQPFSNGPRPPHHQPPPNQHHSCPVSDMMSQAMGFQFPRPTQLPDELESALAIRGSRDMDHRVIDHMSRPNQHQNQSSGSGNSQHGNYCSNPIALTSDNQPGHQQGVDWSSYQPPAKLFACAPPSASHQPKQHPGPQQQPLSSHTGTSIPSWTPPVSDSPSQPPQARTSRGGGGGGDGQSLYTPESAGSILASFGLSNEDLEVLSHYPDDQLTPDTLPFILRDIQINKSGNTTTVASTSTSRTIHDMPLAPSCSSPLARSCSPEVPSLLTVTQTAGKVIDYGHASRAKEDSNTRETFKREQLSSERTVKMFPASSSSSAPKLDKTERRQVRLEPPESSKHGDRDYRRTSSDHRKSNRSPGREFPTSSKSRNLDRDYRHDGPKPRQSPETRSEALSRCSLSSSSGSKPLGSGKKLPTSTMISDFSAVSPKVYPHTCSLCHIQCDQEKDWVDHINTVNHTAACRDLRNKYPAWKPTVPRSSRHGQYGSQALWDHKDRSSSHSVSRSLSHSPSPSHNKHRAGPHPHKQHGRPYAPHHPPRYPYYAGTSSRTGVKRPHDDSTRLLSDPSRHLPFSKAGPHSSKHRVLQPSSKSVKSTTRPGTRTTKMPIAKTGDTPTKPPAAKKKKKKTVTAASQDASFAHRLVYLTGIPKDASEQEVTDLVGSFGKINNVILMPCSEEESKKGEGQKASVCMVKAEDAQALANSTKLSIREQQITASVAKKPEGTSSDANSSKPAPGKGNGVHLGAAADQKSSDERGIMLIAGLPESVWSESDIIKLVQPFGTPSDIILAKQIGKVLVSVPDMEIAQEMVKVNSFIPMKINDCELKMTFLKPCISLSTPVALYNLLMGSVDPLESSAPVSWSSLLVISNVPHTPPGSCEVQKLVRRFGTVIKTLVLNNMVICEMATAAMALSVYKRFQTFPCIIQNNPLFFSRKPDPKTNIQTKVISAYLDSSQDIPENTKGSKRAANAGEEETAHPEDSESALEGMAKDSDVKVKEVKSTEKTADENRAVGENCSKDHEDNKDLCTSQSSATPEADLEADARETSAAVERAEKTDVSASKSGNDEAPLDEEPKLCRSEGEAAFPETAMPELPKVTQEMVKALLVECRTRSASRTRDTAAFTNGEQVETQSDQVKKAADETKEPAKKQAEEEEEEELKRQERERKEREARKEKERRERERRAWEKERAKRDREERARREEERREWERRERARRERKRLYDDDLSGLRSSHRSEGYKQTSWRDGKCNNTGAESKTVEEEDFPFNMSDFVTVDEVGDVTDLPNSPSPTVPMETTEEYAPTFGQTEAPVVPLHGNWDTPMDVTTETIISDATVAPVTPDDHVSESEPVTVLTADTSDGLVSSDFTPSPAAALQCDCSPNQTPVPTYQVEVPETESSLTASQDSTAEEEPVPIPIPAPGVGDSAHSQAAGKITGNEEKDTGDNAQDVVDKMVVVSDKTEEQEKMQNEEDQEMGASTLDMGTHERSEDQTNTEEENKKISKTETPMSADYLLPPFDPSSPVGMELLVPKTGFFCKACNRFFSGTKEAEISHCKTLKHYKNLQNYVQNQKTVNVTIKLDSR